MRPWFQGLALFFAVLVGCGGVYGVFALLVLALHSWPYPTLALFSVVAALALRGRFR